MPAGSTLNTPIPAPDDLISGNVRTQPLNLAAGAYVRGEVVGLIAGETTLKKLSVANTVPFAIIPEAQTLGAAADRAVYIEGDFNQDAIVLTAGTIASVKPILSQRGIMLRKWGAAPTAS